MRNSRLTAVMAWVLSALLVLTPFTQTLASSFDEAASQGQAFGRSHVPDPGELFGSDGEGYTIFPDSDEPLHISAQDLFDSGHGSRQDLKNLWGDDDAINKKTRSVRQRLATSPSEWGQAYRVLKSSSDRLHPDISEDPIWGTNKDVIGKLFSGNGAFSACEITRQVTGDSFSTHLSDYRSCNKVAPIDGTCTVSHNYTAGVLRHVSGPVNMQSCGKGCTTVWLGRVGDDYWDGNCTIRSHYLSFKVLRPKAIRSATVVYAKWDDYMRIVVAGRRIWNGPNDGFPARSDTSCELDTSWERDISVDVTHLLKNAQPGTVIPVRIDVATDGEGEGYARMIIRYDPDDTISNDIWKPSSNACRDKINAIQAGYADGDVTCLSMPPNSNGCLSIAGTTICASDFKPTPIPGLSPLCKKAQVQSDAIFNEGRMTCWTDPQGQRHCPVNHGKQSNTCTNLENNPACVFISSECIQGARGPNGYCYAYHVRYDCGHDVQIPTAKLDTSFSCPGPVRCMGGECINIPETKNDDFARAVAALQAADAIAMDMHCPKGTDVGRNINTCTVFKGKAAECKTAVGGMVDCCKKPSNGVSLTQYLKLMNASRKVAGLVVGKGGVLHGTWTQITKPITSAWNSVTSFFSTSLDANAASTAAQKIGLSQLKQAAMKKTAEFIGQTFGKQAAGLLFEASGGGPLVFNNAGQITGAIQLGGIVGSAISVVMWAYTIYTVAKILIHIIWQCEKSELKLNVKRKLKAAHYVGSYCKTEVFGLCIEERNAYCTFNSPLSRILQEQIRAQLGIGWGETKDPNCQGLTIAQIQKVNWDYIDLSEWLAILRTTGNLPSAPTEIKDQYSMEGLTEDVPVLNVNGEREDVLQRNKDRLSPHATLERNEKLRQELWEQ